MDEWLVAVASPALLAKHGPLMTSQPLERYPLLQSTDEPWVNWREVGAGEPKPVRGSVLDDSVSVIMAAEQGLGFALVRWSLAASDLEAGRLQFASPVALPYRWAYHFVCPKSYVVDAKDREVSRVAARAAKAFPSPATLIEQKGLAMPAAGACQPTAAKPAAAAAHETGHRRRAARQRLALADEASRRNSARRSGAQRLFEFTDGIGADLGAQIVQNDGYEFLRLIAGHVELGKARDDRREQRGIATGE